MDSDLIQLLKLFNRKERFFLIGEALGKKNFDLSGDFRGRLQAAIGLKESIPAGAFAAMDYHIDWIAAALTAYATGNINQAFANEESCGKKLVMGNQEDVDLLVCFKGKDGNYNLIFLEAKGYTSWNSRQMTSKVNRLRLIFGCKGDLISGVKPIYCLASQNCPQKLDCSGWPDWWLNEDKSPYWLKLPLPDTRLRVTRWDADACRPSQNGRHFRILSVGGTPAKKLCSKTLSA